MANRFYLVPVHEQLNNGILYRWPEYFAFSRLAYPGIVASHSAMDYGFFPYMLVLADLTQADHDSITAHADLYVFPPMEELSGPVNDQNIDTFLEPINIPTDWLTPSTTWIELLRQLAGMFQFNQRYGGIAANETGELHSMFDNATLDTRLRQMTAQEQAWFLAAVESFGFDPSIVNTNSQLRLLVRQAGSYWDGRPFIMGGFEF